MTARKGFQSNLADLEDPNETPNQSDNDCRPCIVPLKVTTTYSDRKATERDKNKVDGKTVHSMLSAP